MWQGVGEHGLRGAGTEDETFEEGIRREAIGSVYAGAGSFAGSV